MKTNEDYVKSNVKAKGEAFAKISRMGQEIFQIVCPCANVPLEPIREGMKAIMSGLAMGHCQRPGGPCCATCFTEEGYSDFCKAIELATTLPDVLYEKAMHYRRELHNDFKAGGINLDALYPQRKFHTIFPETADVPGASGFDAAEFTRMFMAGSEEPEIHLPELNTEDIKGIPALTPVTDEQEAAVFQEMVEEQERRMKQVSKGNSIMEALMEALGGRLIESDCDCPECREAHEEEED